MSGAANPPLGPKGLRPLLSGLGALAHGAFLVVYLVAILWRDPPFAFLVAAITLGLLAPFLPYHRSRTGLLAVSIYPAVTVSLLVSLLAWLL